MRAPGFSFGLDGENRICLVGRIARDRLDARTLDAAFGRVVEITERAVGGYLRLAFPPPEARDDPGGPDPPGRERCALAEKLLVGAVGLVVTDRTDRTFPAEPLQVGNRPSTWFHLVHLWEYLAEVDRMYRMDQSVWRTTPHTPRSPDCIGPHRK